MQGWIVEGSVARVSEILHLASALNARCNIVEAQQRGYECQKSQTALVDVIYWLILAPTEYNHVFPQGSKEHPELQCFRSAPRP